MLLVLKSVKKQIPLSSWVTCTVSHNIQGYKLISEPSQPAIIPGDPLSCDKRRAPSRAESDPYTVLPRASPQPGHCSPLPPLLTFTPQAVIFVGDGWFKR